MVTRHGLSEDDPDDVRQPVRRVVKDRHAATAHQTSRHDRPARLNKAVGEWKKRYPGVDILSCSEPEGPRAEFARQIMDYEATDSTSPVTRLRIGHPTVAQDYEKYAGDQRQTRPRDLEAASAGPGWSTGRGRRSPQTSAWRRVEQTTSFLLRQSGRLVAQLAPPRSGRVES